MLFVKKKKKVLFYIIATKRIKVSCPPVIAKLMSSCCDIQSQTTEDEYGQ